MLTRHTVVILLTVNANSEQLCCTPETNIILYVNDTSIKKGKMLLIQNNCVKVMPLREGEFRIIGKRYEGIS